jgi:hypothetical protein
MKSQARRLVLVGLLAALIVAVPFSGYVGFLMYRDHVASVNLARARETAERIRAKRNQEFEEKIHELVRTRGNPKDLQSIRRVFDGDVEPDRILNQDSTEPIREQMRRDLHEPLYKSNWKDK